MKHRVDERVRDGFLVSPRCQGLEHDLLDRLFLRIGTEALGRFRVLLGYFVVPNDSRDLLDEVRFDGDVESV